MVTITYVVSAATMALLLVVTVTLLTRGRKWVRPASVQSAAGKRKSRMRRNVAAWQVGFVLLCIVAIGGTMVSLDSDSATAMLGFIGLSVVGFLAFAVYGVARMHDHPHSHAVGEALVTVGALGLVAVVAKLLLTAGA